MSIRSWFSDSRWQVFLKLVYLIILIIAANFAADWVVNALKIELHQQNQEALDKMILISAIVFCFLLSVPFVPGAEIGITLLWMFGPRVVLLVYACTLIGLLTSFIVGRLISLKALVKLCNDLNLQKAAQLFIEFERLKQNERLTFLVSRAPVPWIPFLVKHRYLALAALINMPGNILLGGGGGIALMAGASRLYSLPGFLGTIAAGVAPIPLAVLTFGKEILPF